MADSIEITIEFEELQPVIDDVKVEGMMLYGKAVLESAYPGEDDSFFVSEIVLDGGLRLLPSGAGEMGFPCQIRKQLFHVISSVIQNPKTNIGRYAQAEFSEAVRDSDEDAGPHVYDARREHGTWDPRIAGLQQVSGARI